jgi:pimeloyl-ACP methyl ester carboxylesterase
MKDFDSVGTGEPLVLIHGALVSRSMWQPQLDEFRAHFQVLNLDLPAHGDVPDLSGPYTIGNLAEYVLERLNSLNISQANLCGHSLGGMVAQKLAVTYPERIKRLVLAETAFGTRNSLWERVQTFFARPFLRLTPQSILVDLSVKQYGSLHPPVADYVQQEMSRYDHRTSIRVMSAAFGFAGKAVLSQIKSPTLILVAENNKQTHAQGKMMAETIPQARFCVIKRADHLLNMDNPEDFNRVVIDFLRSGKIPD